MRNHKIRDIELLMKTAARLAIQVMEKDPNKEYYEIQIPRGLLDLFFDGDGVEISFPPGFLSITKEKEDGRNAAYFLPTRPYELFRENGNTHHVRTTPLRRAISQEERISTKIYRHGLGRTVEE